MSLEYIFKNQAAFKRQLLDLVGNYNILKNYISIFLHKWLKLDQNSVLRISFGRHILSKTEPNITNS